MILSSIGAHSTDINQMKKTRTEKWLEDINYVENVYLLNSKTFPKDSIQSAKSLLLDLKTNVHSYSDNQIILQLSKCVAMANNGHTTIHLSKMNKIPLRFYWFRDGLYIVKSDEASSAYLGAKVLKINAIEVSKVLEQLKPYLSGVDSFKKAVAAHYLSSPQILNGIGLSEEDMMTLTLLKDTKTIEVSFKVKEMLNSTYAYETWADLYPKKEKEEDWRYVLSKEEEDPLYLKHLHEGVFYTFLDTEKIAYFSINALWYKSNNFKGLIKEFLKTLKTKRDYNVVFDLRYYTGGNYLIPKKLATKPPKIIDPNKNIYVITGPMTFSAGLVTAARIKYFAKEKARVVGEEVGDRLKFWAEGAYYKTPNFEVSIQDSKYEHDWKDDTFKLGRTFWVNAFLGVPAKDLAVDEKIILSFEEYQKRKDPILSWIYNDIRN